MQQIIFRQYCIVVEDIFLVLDFPKLKKNLVAKFPTFNICENVVIYKVFFHNFFKTGHFMKEFLRNQ